MTATNATRGETGGSHFFFTQKNVEYPSINRLDRSSVYRCEMRECCFTENRVLRFDRRSVRLAFTKQSDAIIREHARDSSVASVAGEDTYLFHRPRHRLS